jgi:hypothetical protein
MFNPEDTVETLFSSVPASELSDSRFTPNHIELHEEHGESHSAFGVVEVCLNEEMAKENALFIFTHMQYAHLIFYVFFQFVTYAKQVRRVNLS